MASVDTKPIAIYIRVSSHGQEDGHSPCTQTDACRAYAASHELTIDESHIYRKVFTGTELWERPELNRPREVVRANQSGMLGLCLLAE